MRKRRKGIMNCGKGKRLDNWLGGLGKHQGERTMTDREPGYIDCNSTDTNWIKEFTESFKEFMEKITSKEEENE